MAEVYGTLSFPRQGAASGVMHPSPLSVIVGEPLPSPREIRASLRAFPARPRPASSPRAAVGSGESSGDQIIEQLSDKGLLCRVPLPPGLAAYRPYQAVTGVGGPSCHCPAKTRGFPQPRGGARSLVTRWRVQRAEVSP